MSKIKTKLENIIRYTGIAAGTLFLMLIVYYGEKSGEWLKATLLEPPQPFDGTTMPIQKIPNWSKLNSVKNVGSFASLSPANLTDLPPYDASTLLSPDADLKWNNPADDAIRNAKITYPVVYMGSYKLDHQEKTGSHLAVDIKVPTGTPIYAMANGRVTKTSLQSSGYGHHVILKHPDAPDPDRAGGTTSLYSIYAHMSEVYVNEGENVKRGTLIGLSGETGTATSPHLHFQIDRDSAPWHPYWPFTWSEGQAAGLSFFEAVNAGLGKDRGLMYTVNPLLYVQKHLKSAYLGRGEGQEQPHEIQSERVKPVEEKEEKIVTPAEEPPKNIPPVVTEEAGPTDLMSFDLRGEHFGLLGTSVNLYVEDKTGQLKDLKEGEAIRVKVEGNAVPGKRVLKAEDFVSGVATLSVRGTTLGRSLISIGKNQYEVTFIESAEPVAGFRIRHDGDFIQNTPQAITIEALNAQGKATPVYSFNGIIALSAKKGEAKFNPPQLTLRDFKEGSAKVMVTILGDEPVVIRAQNGALVGESEAIHSDKGDLFIDIRPSHPHFQAIKFLKDNKIINGYADGSFKPTQTVNRAEALKMLMLAFDIRESDGKKATFKDTNASDWYATFLSTAVSRGFVSGYTDGTFKPAQTVNRAEYLKILFKTNNLEAGARLEKKPYADVPVDAWFAPYAFLANKKNILPVSGDQLKPLKGVTRAEVAETIYRMKMIELNNWVTYSGK